MTRVRDVIARLHREGSVRAASDGSRHSLFPVAIPETEGHGLARWVRSERAERTIEVGLGYGMAALHVCEALLENGGSELRHVTIDPHQASRFSSCGMQVLEEAGVGHLVELHAAESQVVLPRMLEEGRTFDVAFVDGDHRFDGVFLDLVYLGRLIRPGGIVVLDDHQLPAVRRAVSFVLTNLSWTLEEASDEDELHHWVVVRTSREPDTRSFDDYVDF